VAIAILAAVLGPWTHPDPGTYVVAAGFGDRRCGRTRSSRMNAFLGRPGSGALALV
jgi:hypothetical protein